jgi:ABC-2 type transport system permease protein
MAVALPTMFVSGVFWELDLMPESLQPAATLLPVYHFHRGLRRLMVLDTTDGVAVPFAILGVGAALALVAAIRLTTWQDL